MTVRYCPRCKTDVEDTGGYCLLGHRLALDPPVASIRDLREEIDRAFEEARLEVASVMTTDDVPTAPMSAVARPPAPPPPPAQAADATPLAEDHAARKVPPPPPPPRRPPGDSVPSEDEIRSRNASVWKDLDRDVDIVGDPIGAFAPPPHMDWGPEKAKLKRKPSRRARRAPDAT